MIGFKKPTYIASELPSQTRVFLWLSTFLSLLCLCSVISIPLAVALLVVFIAVSTIKHTFWSPWKRLFLFIPLLTGVSLYVGDINRELGTALLLVTMVVKYVEIRSRKDIGMLLLCNTLAPFVAFLQKENAVLLGVGTATLVLTLVVGQSAFAISTTKKSLARPIASILLWCLVAIPASGLLYVITPRVDNPLWGGMHQKSKTGVGDEMNVAQWTELFNDLSTAFRVRYKGALPKPQEMYFRGTTLWTFDGQVWSSTPTSAGAVIPVTSLSANNTAKFTYDVSYVASTNRLYAMDHSIRAPKNVLLFSDGQMRSSAGRPISGVLSLQSGSSPVSELTESQRVSALQLPFGLNPRTVKQAKSWRKQFSSDEQYVQFVMKYFTSNYEYSLSPPPLASPNVVDSFLFDTKTGFCAHYSSAFAVLMRAANIPTRVVNGYLGNEMDDVGGYFRIRQADAHAWNEVWLNGQWVRFDPTNQVTSVRNRSDMTWDLMNRTYSFSDWLNAQWSDKILSYDEAAQEQLIQSVKQNMLRLPAWIVGAVIAIVVVAFWWRFRRPFKKRHPHDVLSEELHKWFAQFHCSSPNLGWKAKLDAIASSLTQQQYNEMSEIIREVEDVLYGGRNLSVKKLRAKIKKYNKNKPMV